jgi:hypothetical protein
VGGGGQGVTNKETFNRDYSNECLCLFDSFIPDASRVSGLKGQVLAKVNDAGLLVRDWRVAAKGREDITVSFSGAQIYDAPELSGYDFTIELPPRDFGFSANRISSEWTNLHTSVPERKIAVPHCSADCLNETSYLETARGPSEAHRFEACYRWAVDTKEDLAFTVILQGLPMSAEQARSKPYLAANSAPAILLAEISIQFDLCGREVSVCGPVSHQWCDLFYRLLHSPTRHIKRVEGGERDTQVVHVNEATAV